MAIKIFGKAENDPGEWLPFGDSEVRVRLIPLSVAKGIHKRYGKEIQTERDGVRTSQHFRTLDEQQAHLSDLAVFALTDARGPMFELEAADEEAVKVLSRLFGVTPNVGEVVKIEGKLGSVEARKFLLEAKLVGKADVEFLKLGTPEFFEPDKETGKSHDGTMDLGAFCVLAAASLQHRRAQREEATQGNS